MPNGNRTHSRQEGAAEFGAALPAPGTQLLTPPRSEARPQTEFRQRWTRLCFLNDLDDEDVGCPLQKTVSL